ncbi:hypothetical protein TPL01_19010 [Sulfuriferula plumbiphila]|uniref:Cell division protein ZipA n=1 Tax=Sulfuriferula plumbiphila TaxID=171865 RepID=A0A512L8G0_9PROT|nr:cell division protein ZipA C-terminal FtsZ-binding domain-containing protein [Sulfuriferula plumbiphila]BBP05025.1 hypothetical protein SFPGR_24470 [Sulfuriferula plumbiphila]GEP30763.1 hypothetical protein TPL01_19010 [Sulfuriferula plumbiphila]
MNPLQISLIAVAIVVVAAIVLYNWFQERKYRKQSREMFASQQDVLLDAQQGAESDATRIEPYLDAPPIHAEHPVPDTSLTHARTEPAASASMDPSPITYQADIAALREPHVQSRPAPATATAQPESVPVADELPASPADPMIDFEIRLHTADAVPGSAMGELIERSPNNGKPVYWWGYSHLAGGWEEIASWREDAYAEIVIALQLADRNGAVGEDQLVQLCTQARQLASRFNGVAECPDIPSALQRANALDLFCVDVDVLIGLNVVSRDNAVFSGARISELAQRAGMVLAVDGVYQCRNAANEVIYSLCNHESAPFTASATAPFSTHGVTLLFDLPRVADGLVAFDRMTALAYQISEQLGGQLVDDNIRPLTQAGIDKIRMQLDQIYQRMQARGIPGGSERALRLFN